jgi:hypothetical protein
MAETKETTKRGARMDHGSAVYGLGMIGAMVYYLGNAPSFGAGVLGFFKALVWPGFLVHGVLTFLKA